LTAENGYYEAAGNGGLVIRSVTNQGNFGFWQSPALLAGASSGSWSGRQFFTSEWTVSSDQASGADVPTIRLRATTVNASQADLVAIESVGDGSESPTASRTYRMDWLGAHGNPPFQLQFDLLNYDAFGAATGAIKLEHATCFPAAAPLVGEARLERDYSTFGTGTPWESFRSFNYFTGPASSFLQPAANTIPNADGTRGQLWIEAVPYGETGPQQQFGWWNGPETVEQGAITVEAGRRYFAVFGVEGNSSDPENSNRNDTPSFRLRLNETRFKVARLTQVSSNWDEALGESFAQNAPGPNQGLLYMVVFPAGMAEGSVLFTSFDLLTTRADNDDDRRVILTDLKVYSVPIE
jgi:hypothetical protein